MPKKQQRLPSEDALLKLDSPLAVYCVSPLSFLVTQRSEVSNTVAVREK